MTTSNTTTMRRKMVQHAVACEVPCDYEVYYKVQRPVRCPMTMMFTRNMRYTMTTRNTTTMRCTMVQHAVACEVPYGLNRAFCSPPSAAASAGGNLLTEK